MTFYARPSWRLARQIAADVFAVVWTLAWWFVGRAMEATIRVLSNLERATTQTLTDLQTQLTNTANQAGSIPAVGPQLRKPIDQMAASVGGLGGSLSSQASGIEAVASLAGAVVFAIPFLIMLALWLPRRLRYARLTREMRELAASPHGVELLALRALIHEPLSALSAVDADPAGAWTRRDPAALAGFADLELASTGVRAQRTAA